MKFNTDDLRRLPDDFDREIKHMTTSPLILIKNNGVVKYANNHKDLLLEEYDESAGDILLFSWSGNWKTDVFLIRNSDLKKFFVNKGAEKLRNQAEKSKQEAKERRKAERKKLKRNKK